MPHNQRGQCSPFLEGKVLGGQGVSRRNFKKITLAPMENERPIGGGANTYVANGIPQKIKGVHCKTGQPGFPQAQPRPVSLWLLLSAVRSTDAGDYILGTRDRESHSVPIHDFKSKCNLKNVSFSGYRFWGRSLDEFTAYLRLFHRTSYAAFYVLCRVQVYFIATQT